MPKKVLQIKDYSGGLNSYSDPRDLEENEFQVLDNAVVDEQGIIRVSGALEIKENIYLQYSDSSTSSELPFAGQGLYSFKSDYVVSGINFNTALEPGGNDTSSAWGVTSSDVDGTWAFNQLVTNANGNSFNGISGGMAINYLTYSAKGNYNHGSLLFKNLTLKENHTYTLTIKCMSENPWYYLGSNIPPRLRIYNDNQSLYYYPGDGFTSISDATQTALLNDNLSNAFENSHGSGGFAVSDDPDALTWSSASNGDGSWTASDNDQGLVLDQIDASVPVGSSADHKTYNSFFGTTDTSGNMTNGFVLKVTGGAGATAHPFTTKQYIFSNNITVVANTTYLLDAFYNTGAATQSVAIRIYNVSGSAVIPLASWEAGNSSSWRHFNATEEDEVPTPLEFITPVGCTSIRIEVGVTNNSDDEFAYFAGFNMRRKMLELQYCPAAGSIGYFFPFYNLPNSWGNKSGGSVNDSPYIPAAGLNPAFNTIRTYEKVFSIPNNSGGSDWNVSFEAGKWGGANQSGVGNIVVDSIDLVETDDYGEEQDVFTDVVQSNQRGHLIFYHNYNGSNTTLNLLRYNKQNDVYEIASNSSFPSVAGKTNYRMVNTNNGIFFTDSNFNDKNMYRYYYHKDINDFILNQVSHKGPAITQLNTSSTFSNISPDEEYDALSPYLNNNVANDSYIPMMSDIFFGSGTGSSGLGMFVGYNNESYLSLAGDASLLETINQYDGSTLALEHDVAHGSGSGLPSSEFSGFKYDMDASWDDSDWPYTKYITIDKDKLDDDTNTVDGLITDSRIAKIDINLSHFIAIGDGVNNLYKDYIPNMTIYVDVVGDTIADTDKRVNPDEISADAK